jgi:glycosyltransferase involved in cell wall biosynthesis
MLYQQIAQMMGQAYCAPRFRYEPYLWDINRGFVKGSRFGPEDLSAFGMYAHRASPLFLSGSHPVHDPFMQTVFGDEPLADGDPQAPDAWLAKVIRGSGRLESYLKQFPDLKLIICLRNPVDTINSSMGMFSFTGEEFHASDGPRLLAELNEHLPHLSPPDSAEMSHLAISTLWWRAFTEWSLRVAANYPKRCHVVRYESYSAHTDVEIDKLCDFLGFSSANAFKVKLGEQAGPKISSTHLLASDMAELHPHLTYYIEECLQDALSPWKRKEMQLEILQRFAERPFSPQIAADRLGRKSTVQLRGDLLSGRNVALKYSLPTIADPVRMPLRERLLGYASSQRTKLGAYKAYSPLAPARRERKTFGCFITCFNDAATIRDAIFSALDQTMPFDRIVVVDDGSTDGSQALLRDLEGRYSSLSMHYTQYNSGISAARHVGFGLLGTDYFTQLDGDDVFWPTKTREEAEVIFDDPTAIAFSPILLDKGPENSVVLDSSEYVDDAANVFDKLLGRDPYIPRDMTIASDLYRKIGGYDLQTPLYEDWDIKLRLARVSGPWRMSGAYAGTVYNRRRPGLSKLDGEVHVRGMTNIFLKNVIEAPEVHSLARRYAASTSAYKRPLTTMLQGLLERCDAGEFPVTALRPLTTRRWIASTAAEYCNQVEALVADPTGQMPISWVAGNGFGPNEAPFSAIERPKIHWQLEQVGTLDITTRHSISSLVLEVCNPTGENRVGLELQGPKGIIFEAEYPIAPSERVGKTILPSNLPVEVKLAPGKYKMQLKTQAFREEASRVRKDRLRKLYIIVTDVRAV